MKRVIIILLNLFILLVWFPKEGRAQVVNEPVCAFCGEPIDKHKPDCIQGDSQLLEELFPREEPATGGNAADSFVVDFNNKEQILLFKDPKVKRCALAWDGNKDGELTVGEAETVIGLWLMFPHRKDMFVISCYDDLRFFPNLEYLHAGKSWRVEVIDLSHNPKLKEVNLYYCDRKTLKEVRYAEGLTMVQKPSRDRDFFDEPDVFVRVDLADKPEALPSYRYRVKSDSIVIEGEDFSKYSVDVNSILIEDDAFRLSCLARGADRNNDYNITSYEAELVGTLDFNETENTGGPTLNTDFSELRYFPRLHTLRTGTTYIDTLDLSKNLLLKEVDASRCQSLTTIILAEGCQPHIIMPVHSYQGQAPKIIRVKPSKELLKQKKKNENQPTI